MPLVKIGTIALMAKGYVTNNGLPYFQRAVPTALQPKFGKKLIRIKLDARNGHPAVQCIRLWEQYEAFFATLRRDPHASPQILKDAAQALLRRYGLEAGDAIKHADYVQPLAEQAVSIIDGKKRVVDSQVKAVTNETPHVDHFYDNEFHPSSQPSELALIAEKLLRNRLPVNLSEAFEVYLDNSEKGHKPEFIKAQKQHWNKLITIVGDVALSSLDRSHAKLYRDRRLSAGVKTTTVDREINAIKAIFTSAANELSIEMANPFMKLKIPGLGSDSKKRVAYSKPELRTLLNAALELDDDIRRIFIVLLFTGARLAEVAGLKKQDIDLSEHSITFTPNPSRSIKTGVTRIAPLHTIAFQCLQKAINESDSDFIFPRYFSSTENKAKTASATMNKWAKQLVPVKTVHCLRHAVRDLYRAVECEESIAIAIVGWETDKETSKFYGEGYPLTTKKRWMERAWRWLDTVT